MISQHASARVTNPVKYFQVFQKSLKWSKFDSLITIFWSNIYVYITFFKIFLVFVKITWAKNRLVIIIKKLEKIICMAAIWYFEFSLGLSNFLKLRNLCQGWVLGDEPPPMAPKGANWGLAEIPPFPQKFPKTH